MERKMQMGIAICDHKQEFDTLDEYIEQHVNQTKENMVKHGSVEAMHTIFLHSEKEKKMKCILIPMMGMGEESPSIMVAKQIKDKNPEALAGYEYKAVVTIADAKMKKVSQEEFEQIGGMKGLDLVPDMDVLILSIEEKDKFRVQAFEYIRSDDGDVVLSTKPHLNEEMTGEKNVELGGNNLNFKFLFDNK